MTRSVSPIPVRVWVGYSFVLLAVVLVIIDYTVADSVVPDLVRDLDLTVDDVGATLTSYLAVAAAFIVPAGRLADRVGRRRFFLNGLALYAAGSVLTGLAWGFWPLLVGRVLQGLSLATVLPTGLGLLNSMFPPDRPGRHRALGLWATAIGVAAGLGPLVGGTLAVTVSWRLAFLGGVPLAALAAVGIRLGLPESERQPAVRFDVAGTMLLVLAAGSLVVVAERADRLGVGATAVLLAGVVAALTGFVWVENARARAGREVVASLALFRKRSFAAATVTATLMSFGDVGFQLVLPLFTGFVFGYDPLAVGLVLAAYGLGIGLGGPLAEQACRFFDERTVALAAVGVLPVALVALIPMFSPDGSGTAMAGVLAVYGVAWGVAYATLVNMIFRDVPESASAMAGGMQSSMRLLAGALGAAVLTAVFAGVSVPRVGSAENANQHQRLVNASPKVLDTHRRLGRDRQGQPEPLWHDASVAAAVSAAYSAGAQATIAVAAGLNLLAICAGLALPRGKRPRSPGDQATRSHPADGRSRAKSEGKGARRYRGNRSAGASRFAPSSARTTHSR
jgi:EmrB/QacA subfamily drug resistance transporter